MAYGLKYYFDDKLQVGSTSTTYRFEILQDGYSGSATEWIGREISRQYEEVSLRKIEPIQKSSCTGIIAVESSSQRTILESIAGSEPGQYKVQLKKDGSVIWTGLVIPDLTVIGEDNYGNQSANIVAKDIFITGNFPLATIFPDTRGIEKAIILIADILDDMDYQLDIISYTSWIEAGLTQSDDILNQSYHEKERFRKYGRTEGEDDQPLTNQEALEYILTAYGLILRQVDGDWNLLQITAFENPSSVRRYVYDYQGTQTSSSTTFTAPSITEGNDLYVQGSSSNNYFAGVKSVKSQFQHESLIQGIKFNREYWIDDGSELAKSQYWQADGTGNLELSFITWYAKTTITDLGNPVIASVSIFIDTGSTDYYWNGTSWVTSPATIPVEVQETHSAVDSDGNYIFKNLGIDIVTAPIPSGADGTLNVKITPDSLQIDYAYWYLRDVQFSLKYSDTTDGISTDILYELTQTQAFSSVYDYGKYYFGDGPTEASLSALKNSSRVLLSQWKRAGDSSTTNHQNLILNEILNVRRGQRRNIRARLYGEYEPDNILVYDSTNFFFLGGSWSSRSYQWSANFFEINISEVDTDSLSFTFVTDGSGTSGGAVGSTGTSTGTSSLYLEKGKNLSDLPTPATARTNLGLGTGDSPTFNGLTSTGVIITDEIDTTSIVWDALTPEVFWVTSEEKFNNPVFIGTSLDVDNGINADQHIHAGTYLKADTYLEVGTSATIGTTLDVTGATTLSTLDASGNTTVGGTLNVTGNTTISGTLDAPTLNTGQGDNELYAMNQDVQTSDSVTFNTLAVTNNTTIGGSLTLTGEADFNSTMNLQGNLTTQADLQDDGYSPSWSGSNWKIQADGTAEFQELFVRGALTVFEFIAKQISTIGGSEILSIAQGKIDTVTPGSGAISFENTGGAPGISFKAGDLWICQVTSINQDKQSGGSGVIVKSVTGEVSFTTGNSIITSVTSGSLNDLAKGDLVVVYGNSGTDANAKARQAIMYRNVDRSVDSLIMRMQTGVDTFSKLQDEANTRIAFGDLGPRPSNSTGYSGLTEETFGFFAGNNSAEHILVTENGLSLKDGAITLAELSAGTFKVGDDTNFISFNNTSLNITTNTFSLDTTNIHIDSSTNGGQIRVGSGDEVILGNLSSTERGLSLNSNNFWKFNSLTSGYFFKVGDATNFISFNTGGNLNVKTNTFTLDTTSDGNGIKIESANQRIQFEDESRVRTQVDVNDGGFSLTETVHSTNDEDAVVNEGESNVYTRDEIPQITKGDSILIDVSANCTSLGTGGGEAYYQVLVYGGTTSSSQTNLISTFLSNLVETTSSPNNNATAVFSVYSYDYDYIKVQIQVFSNSPSNNAQFTLDQDIIMKSYNSQTRVSLDGVFVNNSDTQFAKLTRSANELSGIIKLTNLPTVKPNQTGVLYKTSDGTLKVS